MTIILFLLALSSSFLGVTYSNSSIIANTKVTKLSQIILWWIIYILLMLAYSFAAQTNFPFSNQGINTSILDAINYNDCSNFIQYTILLAIIIIPIYYVLRWSRVPIYYLIAFLGICSILIYYPGIPCADTTGLYDYVINNQYSDWQPTLYTIFWHLNHAYGSAFIANTFFYYVGVIGISYYLHKNNKFWQNYILLLFCANPIFYSQLNIVLKDTLFVGLLVDLIAIFLLMCWTNKKSVRICLTIIASLIAFLCCGIRYNGILAIVPFSALFALFWMPKYWSKKMRVTAVILTTTVINICIVQLNLLVAYNIFHAKKVYSPTLVIYNDLVNIECATNHAFKIPQNLLNHKYSTQDIQDTMCNDIYINYFNYDPISIENWNGTGNKAILIYDQSHENYLLAKAAWQNAVLDYPISYISYRARFFLNVLLKQWYMPPYFAMATQFYPAGISQPNIGIFSQIQLSIAKIAYSQQIEVRLIGLLIIASIFGFFGFFICSHNVAIISKTIFYSNILSLIGLYLVVGENAARFFLWNYFASVLMIIFTFNKNNPLNIIDTNISNKNSKRKKK